MTKNMLVASIILVALLSSVALAQTADVYRDINKYGSEYRPFSPEQLRLLAPTNVTPLDFQNSSYAEVLAAKVVSGEFYILVNTMFQDLPKNVSDAGAVVKAQAMKVCGFTDTPSSLAQKNCYIFYVDVGKNAWELQQTTGYNICRGNAQGILTNINDQLDAGNITTISASLEWASTATALKWCQINFGQNVTVVPPTPENTKFSPPGWWSPPENRTIVAPPSNHTGAKPPTPPKKPSNATTGASPAPWSLSSYWIYGAIGLVVLTVIIAFIVTRKPKKPAQAHEPESVPHEAGKQHHPSHEQHKQHKS
jgi:hypothetical protein